ncbi:MAG: sugar phosphate isomerase/epimerase [Actinomycetota bacterium]
MIAPVKVDMLSNCAPVLRADPYSLDNDALAESIEASRAAGFDAVGLWGFHVMFGGEEAAAIVTDAGMPVQTIDAALSWVNGPSDGAIGEIDGLIALAEQLGAGVIHATTLDPEVDLSAAAEGYAQIAERAEAAGKVLGLEFLPWTGIPTLAAANQICENAGPAAGILLDAWHWVRQPGGPDLELLRSLPGHRITSVQLSDVAVSTDLDTEPEAMTARLLPGDGIVDYAALWGALDHIGATPVVAAEVMSAEMVAEGPASMAAKVHDACRTVLP